MIRRTSRVLVVDDSAMARRMLVNCLIDSDIEVVGEASDASRAHELVARHQPDVITLDIEMPEIDGLSFLRQLMKYRPTPVIIISSHTPPGSVTSVEALRAGAVDVISKPKGPDAVVSLGRRLKQKIRELRDSAPRVRPQPAVPATGHVVSRADHYRSGIVGIGASAGGPQALEVVLRQLPPNAPPVVIVQHMPAPFVPLLAERLNQMCPMRIGVATNGEELVHGRAYLAAGDRHLVVEQVGGVLRARLNAGDRVHHQRPAVDVLFKSLARVRGVPILGVLLTGMGHDGAEGMVALRAVGHETIAEDSHSCVVFGMPREAIARGGASRVLMLDQIPAAILNYFQHSPRTLKHVHT